MVSSTFGGGTGFSAIKNSGKNSASFEFIYVLLAAWTFGLEYIEQKKAHETVGLALSACFAYEAS
jgi:hypothetical protein